MHLTQTNEPNVQRSIGNKSQPDVQHDNEDIREPHPSGAPQNNHPLQREEDGFINERSVHRGEAGRRTQKRVDVRGEQLLAEGRMGGQKDGE